jgi:serine/threonine protein kinase
VTASPAPLVADRYEVIRPLGQGAFGRTLLARDLRLDRLVTLKVLHPRAASGWKAYELFEREAAVLKGLRHPAVPAVHAAFRAEWDGAEAAFLVMEYVEGVSLAEVIAERRHLESTEVMELFVELLGVLDYLHTRVPPILHRDIKPANLILRPTGTPALVDFGAVRNVFRAPEDGGSTVVGTYGYMPYEQYMGQASPASDLFALGATFLHLVTGRAPPEFMSDAGRLEVPADLPCGAPLRAVLVRLLAHAPGDRFQSAREARAALLAGAGGVGASTPPVVGTSLAPRIQEAVVALPPVPRELSGSTAALFKRVAPSAWRLMNSSVKQVDAVDPITVLLTVFFSIVTVGILPGVFWSTSLSRKRRLKPFFLHGLPATARVLDMGTDDIGFGEKFARVRYEFEADGSRHRGSDQVLPTTAEHWERGDAISILYLPNRDYDSVILATT